MELIDIIILAILAAFGIMGFKRGVFQSLVMFLGFIIVIVLAYTLKNFIGDFFVLNLPFINFGMGIATLNVIMYQALAFFIVLIILGLVYKFVIALTGIFEKLLKITIILGIPSKILGMIVGILEGYIVVYMLLFFLNQPFLRVNLINDSKYVSIILNKTPVLSSYVEDSLNVISEVRDAIKINNRDEMELKLADIILKEKVTSPNIMQKLVDKNKIKVNGIQEIINKYQE